MIKGGILAFAILAVLTGPALAQPTKTEALFPTVRQARPIQLAKIVVNIKRGESIGRAKYAALCLYPEDLTWKMDSTDVKVDRFDALFREAMAQAGFAVAGNPSKMFSDHDDDDRAEYLIGGSIDHMDMRVCYRNVNGLGRDYERSSGTASIDVEWQIYSQIERKVVAVIKTTGTASRPKSEDGGAFGLVFDAFGDSVRQLASNERFAKVFKQPATNLDVARLPERGLVPLQVKAPKPAPIPINDAVASTALIFANGGEGSGFLISSDGYLLTNHHVVGGNQYVKVRWSDGAEVLGEVIRSDKLRDVALIKTDPKGHRPLALRAARVTIGEDIYAIGAPTGARFQNTVTKGIVSATRVFNGFNFIQSDVGVTHGNSGGPIMDGKGQVVGLTDLGFDDAPMVNLFIPIDEALGFLGIQMQ